VRLGGQGARPELAKPRTRPYDLDYLRAHPLAAQAYGQAKTALSKHGPTDWDLYYDVKDPLCDIIMAGAED